MAFFIGTTGNDSLYGTDQNDLIFGGAGDDIIDGGAGNDKLGGDEGNDTFIGGAGADSMSGGAGIDTVDYSNSRDAVNVSLTAGTGSGGDAQGDTLYAIENLIGSNNVRASDTLTGDGANNVLDGRAGSDTLVGGGGNDTLIGGLGNDKMSGGADADIFVFHTLHGWGGSTSLEGVDIVTDFQVGVDQLEFAGAGINSVSELSVTQVGNDTVISYGYHSSSITLQNVDAHNLMAHQAHDFLFS